MSDFLSALGKAAKAIGNAYLDSCEDTAHRCSRDREHFSDEQREQYAQFESNLKSWRNKDKSRSYSNDDDYDY